MAKTNHPKPVLELKAYFDKTSHLGHAQGLMFWDQQTYMPESGNAARAAHLATLSEVIHERMIAPELGTLIRTAKKSLKTSSTDIERAYVRESERAYDLATKLPTKLVKEFMTATGHADQAWKHARAESKFKLFEPHLKKVVGLSRQMADRYGYQDHPYDALLDLYEPGATVRQLDPLFDELRGELVPLLAKILKSDHANREKPLQGKFGEAKEIEISKRLAVDIGYDFSRGRLDLSAHPFSIPFSPDDARITTRVGDGNLAFPITSTLHEAGHAMYEQGIDKDLGSPIAGGVSVGVHESQSRLWENLVGRSRPFWKKHLPLLHRTFPQTTRYRLEDIHRAFNAVRKLPIRVEADEVSYNLHILVRFEIEKALIEGSLAVKDLPEVWNAKMREYLGITPKNDAEGVLQDVHWSGGSFGYFPTYTIGTVMSVQLFDTATKSKRIAADVRKAKYGLLLKWLRTHVHRYGGTYPAEELLKKATGSTLTTKPYLDYLREKYGELYDL